jgi:glycerate kinase
VTGEGRIDSQSINGKTPVGVARVARRHGKPVIGIGGSLAPDVGVVHTHGIDAVFGAVCRPCTVPEALAAAAANLRLAGRNVAAAIRLGARLVPGNPSK